MHGFTVMNSLLSGDEVKYVGSTSLYSFSPFDFYAKLFHFKIFSSFYIFCLFGFVWFVVLFNFFFFLKLLSRKIGFMHFNK